MKRPRGQLSAASACTASPQVNSSTQTKHSKETKADDKE